MSFVTLNMMWTFWTPAHLNKLSMNAVIYTNNTRKQSLDIVHSVMITCRKSRSEYNYWEKISKPNDSLSLRMTQYCVIRREREYYWSDCRIEYAKEITMHVVLRKHFFKMKRSFLNFLKILESDHNPIQSRFSPRRGS